MLIYNYQKEFLGMDERDLHIFGFSTFEELRSEVNDFADLFIKTPGYVHNFQHIHWIDFVQYSDEIENAKVLINANAQTFSATLKVSKLFLIDNPTAPAYAINFHNLRTLSQNETQHLSTQISKRELPKVQPQHVETTSFEQTGYESEVENTNDIPLDINFEEETLEYKQEADIADLSLDVFNESTPVQENAAQALTTTTDTTATKKEETENKETEVFDNGYHYDPQIASQELGLPVDLIEEFIQDFILQAKEFHDDIYLAIEQEDIEKVKTLSHKLKGVAANLRIEDAHEVLSSVSASSELPIIHENINTFYKIIAKLSGEPATQQQKETQTEEVLEISEATEEIEAPLTISQEDETTLELSFKDDTIEENSEEVVHDEDVPEKIDIPELADDDFFTNQDELANQEIQEEKTTDLILYSKTAAAQDIGLDLESFNELFEDFEHESHIIFKNIQNAIEENDLEKCRNEVVKFKTMSDNMRLHEFAAEIDILLYSSDKENLQKAANKIDTTISKISKMGA